MSEYMIDGTLLTSIAEEVRSVDGSSSTLTPAQMVNTLTGVDTSIGAALLALTGNKTSTLSVNVADGQFYHYRVKMTDVRGRNAYSNAAMLSVAGHIAITKQPVDVVAATGQAVTFSVEATGDGLSYQWYYKYKGASTWTNVAAASGKTAEYKLAVEERHNGYRYHCIITDANGNSVTTNEVTLTVGAIGITKQPMDVVAAAGASVTFHVAAQGDGLSYQWQRSENKGATWLNCTSTGAYTADWTFEMFAAYDGIQYRCVVSDGNGNSVITNVITLSLASNVSITTQPVNVEANIGDTATFTVEAENVATYQWQVSTDSGATWRNIALSDAKYTVNSGNTVHDLAGLIADIGSTLVPPWATEFETAQVSVTSSSKSLSVPCTMSAAPTSHILFVSIYPTMSHTLTHHEEAVYYYTQVSGDTQYTRRLRYVGHIVTQSGDMTLDIKKDIKVGTWTLANGIATLEAQDQEAYYTGHTYNIIMWR